MSWHAAALAARDTAAAAAGLAAELAARDAALAARDVALAEAAAERAALATELDAERALMRIMLARKCDARSVLAEHDALCRRLELPNVRAVLLGEAFLDVIGVVSTVGYAAEVGRQVPPTSLQVDARHCAARRRGRHARAGPAPDAPMAISRRNGGSRRTLEFAVLLGRAACEAVLERSRYA